MSNHFLNDHSGSISNGSLPTASFCTNLCSLTDAIASPYVSLAPSKWWHSVARRRCCVIRALVILPFSPDFCLEK